MLPQSARLLALACLSLFVSCISAGVFRSYTARVGLQKVKLMPHQEIMNKRTLWLRFGPWDMISHNPLTGFATFAYQNANQHHLEMTGVWLEEHGMLRFAAPGEEWTNNGTFYGEDAQGIKISGKWIGQAHWDVNLPKPEWLRTHTSEQMSQADKDNMRDRYWKSDKGGDQSTKTEMANGSNQNTRASGSNLPITGTLTSRWPHDPEAFSHRTIKMEGDNWAPGRTREQLGHMFKTNLKGCFGPVKYRYREDTTPNHWLAMATIPDDMKSQLNNQTACVEKAMVLAGGPKVECVWA